MLHHLQHHVLWTYNKVNKVFILFENHPKCLIFYFQFFGLFQQFLFCLVTLFDYLKCKCSSLRLKWWMRLFLWFSNTVTYNKVNKVWTVVGLCRVLRTATFLGMASSYSAIMGCHGHHHHWKCIDTRITLSQSPKKLQICIFARKLRYLITRGASVVCVDKTS